VIDGVCPSACGLGVIDGFCPSACWAPQVDHMVTIEFEDGTVCDLEGEFAEDGPVVLPLDEADTIFMDDERLPLFLGESRAAAALFLGETGRAVACCTASVQSQATPPGAGADGLPDLLSLPEPGDRVCHSFSASSVARFLCAHVGTDWTRLDAALPPPADVCGALSPRRRPSRQGGALFPARPGDLSEGLLFWVPPRHGGGHSAGHCLRSMGGICARRTR
jgi:hypothetical protein